MSKSQDDDSMTMRLSKSQHDDSVTIVSVELNLSLMTA